MCSLEYLYSALRDRIEVFSATNCRVGGFGRFGGRRSGGRRAIEGFGALPLRAMRIALTVHIDPGGVTADPGQRPRPPRVGWAMPGLTPWSVRGEVRAVEAMDGLGFARS